MGYGDYLMLSGRARLFKETFPEVELSAPALEGRIFFEQIFQGNPRLQRASQLSKNKPHIFFDQYHVGVRKESENRIAWFPHQTAIPGELYLTPEEIEFGSRMIRDAHHRFAESFSNPAPRIMAIQPYATRGRVVGNKIVEYAHAGNKEWPLERWHELLTRLKGKYLFVAITPPNEKPWNLPNVQQITTNTFREGASVLRACDAYVGIEGGLHHLAATLLKPAVVFFGHWISPYSTGYSYHDNIYFGDNLLGCGSLRLCPICIAGMKSISVAEVAERIDRLFRGDALVRP